MMRMRTVLPVIGLFFVLKAAAQEPEASFKGSWFKLYPETEVVDVLQPVVIPPGPKGVNDSVRTTLEVLLNFPNHFATIYRMLVDMGVQFPDLAESVSRVWIGGNIMSLPKALAVRLRFNTLGENFIVPRDAAKLPAHILSSQRLLVRVLTALRQLGAVFSLDYSGQIVAFKLFGETRRFHRALPSKPMSVEGKDYYFPADIQKFLTAYAEKPAELFKVQMVLEAFGVHFSKSPGQSFPRATYRDTHYDITSTPVRRIAVLEKEYDIPADLDSVFRGPQSLQVGEILSALQRANMTLEVVQDTGLVRGVTANNVMFRFPVVLDLRFKMDGVEYIIPHDLGKLVAALERRNMPSYIVSVLYSRYGLVPVRDPENVVTALSFNGENFPIKASPKTVVVLGGKKYILPTDADKMATAVANKKVTPIQLMQVLQLAGYTFIPDPDGILRWIQNGADRIDLHMEIRLFVKLGNVQYRMPSDLPRLLEFVRTLRPQEVEMIMNKLGQYGVIVSKRGSRLLLMFNGIKYEARLNSGVSDDANHEIKILIDHKPYKIPTDLDSVVAQAKKRGRAAVDMVMDLLQSYGIKVNRSPEGDVKSIKMNNGKSYKVGDGGRSSESSGGGAGRGAAGGSNGGSSGSGSDGNRGSGGRGSGSGSGSDSDSDNEDSSSGYSGERCNIDVRIRGQFFRLPEELPDLPKKLKNFKYVEVFIELVHKGATLLSDDESNFYAYRINGCHIVFPQRFRILVKVDRTGKKFRVPGELGSLAKTLSSGEWNWAAVRNALRSAGIHVAGYKGPVKRFSFQGKRYHVR